MLPNNFPPLVRPIKASRRHFCVQFEREAQSKKQKMADPTTCRVAGCVLIPVDALLDWMKAQGGYSE